jgi:phage shock protein A
MAMFAKKESWDNKVAADLGGSAPPAAAKPAGSPKYGIAETIHLMRTLPAENGELVVRVVRATLASLDVRLPDIIADATQKQKVVRDRIADFHAKNAELEKQLDAHRKEIATLEADLKETTEVKDRLQLAESNAPTASEKLPTSTLIGTAAHGGPFAASK